MRHLIVDDFFVGTCCFNHDFSAGAEDLSGHGMKLLPG